MTTPMQIVEAARKYLGVRWRHQGRSVRGIDCIGLVIAVARDLGLSDYDITDYGRIPDGHRLRDTMAGQMRPSGPDRFALGNVLLMRFEAAPIHVGICTDIGMIHAFANMRRVVEHRLDSQWRGRVLESFRFPGMA